MAVRKQVNKLRNKKVMVSGILFDSKREASRYLELLMLERSGKISNLELQKEYELIPAKYEAFPRYGKKGQRLKDGMRCVEKSLKYKADFVYIDNESGQKVVEDSKGYRDPKSATYAKFVIKRKLMLHIYGIKVREV